MQKQERLDFNLCGQYIQITARLKTASTISVFENSRPIHSDQSFTVSSKHHYGLCGQQTQIRVLLYAESTFGCLWTVYSDQSFTENSEYHWERYVSSKFCLWADSTVWVFETGIFLSIGPTVKSETTNSIWSLWPLCFTERIEHHLGLYTFISFQW